MEVLLLGIESQTLTALRRHFASLGDPKIHLHLQSFDADKDRRLESWDVILVSGKVRSKPALARQLRSPRVSAIKIVIADKEKLRATIDEWGSSVFSYLLKPVSADSFHLVWQNALSHIEMNKKLSRLSKQHLKKREDEVEQKEVVKSLFVTHLKMQELNQEKTNFLARTSHELLTPLTALNGYLQLLQNGKAGELNEVQTKVVKSSLDSCGRLMRLAKSLTDLAALDRSENSLQLAVGDLGECITKSIAEIEEMIRKRNLDFDIEISTNLPQLKFDFDRMQQVFINLLENAVKFTPEGGKIHVTCTPYFWERRSVNEMIRVSSERRAERRSSSVNSIRIEVKDTGVGVAPEFLLDIFEEYSRVSADSATVRGFGLGLSVARRIVLAHDGKIWAESKQGQGSTFYVLIPISN